MELSVSRRDEKLKDLNTLVRAAMRENEEERNRINQAFDYATDILSPGPDDLGKGQINLPKTISMIMLSQVKKSRQKPFLVWLWNWMRI